jgi:hypothetical protein
MPLSASLLSGSLGRAERDTSDPVRPALAEHSLACLSNPVDLEDGRRLPAGARGTIVFVHGDDEAYMVEFTSPFHVITTVLASDLKQVAAP